MYGVTLKFGVIVEKSEMSEDQQPTSASPDTHKAWRLRSHSRAAIHRREHRAHALKSSGRDKGETVFNMFLLLRGHQDEMKIVPGAFPSGL